MEIKFGTFEYQPGLLVLGGLLALAWTWHRAQRRRFKFYRPDAEFSEYYLFWGPLEIMWEGPKALRRYRSAA